MIVSGGAAPKVGIITCGKSYLGRPAGRSTNSVIDEVEANRLGIRLYKVGMTWPLEPKGVKKFAEGLDLIIVVEEKRSLIETQVKEQLYGLANAPRVIGKKDENEHWLFHAKGALDPTEIALAVGERLINYGAGEAVKAKLSELKRLEGNAALGADTFSRTPYFCAGCPHNSSTVVPEGARAYAGIGCHYMSQWMDRSTEGFTQMGGEGTNWIGEAPFSKRRHVFQNLGDGTYIPLGLARDPGGGCCRRQHHVQDPLQRRRSHDRRPDARRAYLRADDRGPTRGRGRKEDRHRHRRAGQVCAGRDVPFGRRHPSPPRPAAGADRAVEARWRHRRDLRPDLRRREAPPPQEGRVPRSRQAHLHQRGRVRRLRRLRQEVELRRGDSERDRARPQARHRPVGLQQGLFVHRGLLPELRHRARREGEEVEGRGRQRCRDGEPRQAA